MATVVGTINRFIPSGYVLPTCRISLGSKFTGLDLDLETFGLGLEDFRPWPWPRKPVVMALEWPRQCCPRTHPWKFGSS